VPAEEESLSPVREVVYQPAPRSEEPARFEVQVSTPEVEAPPVIDTVIPEAYPEVEVEAETPLEAVLPEWSSEPFQALLFKVAGLTMAVPLVELNGVVEWQDNVTEMPGHAAHYMGILQHLDKSVPVVDTARLVLPPDKLHTLAGDNPRERVSRIVLIDGGRWGLACDEVDEVVTLQPDDVRWRSNRTRRAWLLGTVIEHMCALLDVPAFSKMLKDGR
ncbi:MAG: chemotaxis protein CheW, partial [Thioalkalispiraceae bacterium]